MLTNLHISKFFTIFALDSKVGEQAFEARRIIVQPTADKGPLTNLIINLLIIRESKIIVKPAPNNAQMETQVLSPTGRAERGAY